MTSEHLEHRRLMEARLEALEAELDGMVRQVTAPEPAPGHRHSCPTPTFRSTVPTGGTPPKFVQRARLAVLEAEVRSLSPGGTRGS